MGQDTPSWEDVPSLEGLEVDWDFKPENPLGKRVYARLTAKELYPLLRTKNVPVKLVTQKSQTKAFLVDVSQGGVALRAKATNLKESQLVKLGFFLGNQKVISKGRIKNIRKKKDWFVFGIEFIELSEDNYKYIAHLYLSVKIKS